MTDLRQAAQQALDALVLWEDEAPYSWSKADANAVAALRAALEQQQAEPSQWRDMVVVNLVREGVNKHKARELADHFATLPQQQAEPVSHAVIAGALFDFMGWLTTRKERLVLSSTDNASPAADAIKDFAEMRGLLLDDAKVQDWQAYTTPPQRQWVGLTDEDVNRESAMIAQKMKLAFHAGMYVAQQILKEKNSD